MLIAIMIFALFVIIWAIATCSANEGEQIVQLELLKAENKQQKEELTILRNYIRFNHLECDVMAYYGRSDEQHK